MKILIALKQEHSILSAQQTRAEILQHLDRRLAL